MKRTLESNRLARLAALVIVAACEATAQTAQKERAARRIVISISDRKLFLLEGEQVLKTYDVAVGALVSPSPRGDFEIVSRAINPVWKNVPPGPANPVGTRWLGLSIKGYGIHGTNAPGSIGKAASHGCIRMRNRDVEELFGLVATARAWSSTIASPKLWLKFPRSQLRNLQKENDPCYFYVTWC